MAQRGFQRAAFPPVKATRKMLQSHTTQLLQYNTAMPSQDLRLRDPPPFRRSLKITAFRFFELLSIPRVRHCIFRFRNHFCAVFLLRLHGHGSKILSCLFFSPSPQPARGRALVSFRLGCSCGGSWCEALQCQQRSVCSSDNAAQRLAGSRLQP